MPTFTSNSGAIGYAEGEYIGDWLKGELESPIDQSRDQIVLANPSTTTAANIVGGTVLGKITASGNFVPLNPAATDGSQTAAALLGPKMTSLAASGTVSTWAITREARVSDINITWPAGATAPQIATAVQQLAALGIKVRRTV